MTDESSPIDEDQLRMLLRGSDKLQTTSAKQRQRIWHQIASERDVFSIGPDANGSVLDSAAAPEDSAIPLELSELALSGRQVRGRRVLVAALAAIGMVVAVMSSGLLSDENEVSVTAPDPEASQPANPTTCPAEIMAFVDAIESWGGVENWSFLTNRSAPEPDLLRLATQALESEALLDEVGNRSAADRTRRLQQVSLDDPDRFWSLVDREEHFEAVAAAQDLVNGAIADNVQFETCQ